MKKMFSLLLVAAMTLSLLTACGNAQEEVVTEEPIIAEKPVVEESADATMEVPVTASADATDITVAALKGPTAMGMVSFMNAADQGEITDNNYDFTIYAAADEITPQLIQGNIDIACVPANLASVLYNKTEGGVEVLAVNTLGVIYIIANGETEVASVEDLRGKTIYASGKGATPEYALNYILSENGINPESDVTIEWKSEHSEALAALLEDEDGIAMLPQPFVTTAQMKNDGIKVVLDLTEEWNKLENGSTLITGVVVARSAFVAEHPEAVEAFLAHYADSVAFVNANTEEAAALIESYDIVKAAVAQKALPFCNITFMTGSEMKEKLSGYLEVLANAAAQAVGGQLPGDDFYYGA